MSLRAPLQGHESQLEALEGVLMGICPLITLLGGEVPGGALWALDHIVDTKHLFIDY